MKKFWKMFWSDDNKDTRRRIVTALMILSVVSFVCITISYGVSVYTNKSIPYKYYSEFLQDVEDGKVDLVQYSPSNEKMRVYLFNDTTKNMSLDDRQKYTYKATEGYYTLYPAYEDFRNDLLSKDVRLQVVSSGNLSSIVQGGVSFALLLMMAGALYGTVRTLNGGESAKPCTVVRNSDIRFTDVIGLDEIMEDVQFITSVLKDSNKLDKIGAKAPRGILLSGPPGTGKTLLAKAVAGEAGIPFIYCNSSSFIELYVGMGARKVRKVFKLAREQAPCILFFDEIDSIGIKRGTGGTSEHEQTINAILQEMDGITPRDGVFIMGATNRPDALDEALVRAGRFDRQIIVNRPKNSAVRKDLFDYFLKSVRVSDDVDTSLLAKQCVNFTGADISAICNEAGLIASVNSQDYITQSNLEEAIEKKLFKGNRTKAKEEEQQKDRELVAYHEAGHAILSMAYGKPIARISIIGSTSGVGGAVFGEDDGTAFTTKADIEREIRVLYGGRVAEELKFNSVSIGASNDITQATQLILQYVGVYGFDDDFGLLDMSVLHGDVESIKLQRLSKISRTLYTQARDDLNKYLSFLKILADKLLEEETLSGEVAYKMFEDYKNSKEA